MTTIFLLVAILLAGCWSFRGPGCRGWDGRKGAAVLVTMGPGGGASAWGPWLWIHENGQVLALWADYRWCGGLSPAATSRLHSSLDGWEAKFGGQRRFFGAEARSAELYAAKGMDREGPIVWWGTDSERPGHFEELARISCLLEGELGSRYRKVFRRGQSEFVAARDRRSPCE